MSDPLAFKLSYLVWLLSIVAIKACVKFQDSAEIFEQSSWVVRIWDHPGRHLQGKRLSTFPSALFQIQLHSWFLRFISPSVHRDEAALPLRRPLLTCPLLDCCLWNDALKNPKRGQDTASRPKKSTGHKENATFNPKSKPRVKKQEVVEQSEEEGGETDSDE